MTLGRLGGSSRFDPDEIETMAGPSSERTPLLGRMGANPQVAASESSLLSREGKKIHQYISAFAACLFAFCAGTTMGWTSSASKLTDGVDGYPKLDDEEFSWVGAGLSIGAIVSAIPVGSLCNPLGRKLLILLMAPIMVAGWALLAWANSFWMMFVGRILLGATVGGYCVVIPMYTGEIAEKSIRGILGSFFQLLITLGILFVYILGPTVANVYKINIICGILPIVMAVVFFFFRDTPRWYILKGRREEARSALVIYRGEQYDVDKELGEIEESLQNERATKVSCTAAFNTTAAKRGLMLAVAVMFFQQFSGINAVIFYASDIFKNANTGIDETNASVIVGVCQVVATAIASTLVDRLGRRILLLLSGSVMMICNVVLGVYFYLQDKEGRDLTGYGMVPIVSVCIFIIMFSFGFGPVPWLYSGELFRSQIKGVAMSIANLVNWLSVFIITKFFKAISNAVGSYTTFWIFGGILVGGVFFVSTVFIETKEKLEDVIIAELEGKPTSRSVEAPRQEAKQDNEGHM